jgi:LacI family transcriptional regulator
MVKSAKRARRVAIVLDLDWPYKRQIEVYRGITRFASEHEHWDCALLPIAEGAPRHGATATYEPGLRFDGIVARATAELAVQAKREKIPLVNVWLNSPVRDVPSVLPNCEAMGQMAARHLIARGLYNLGFLGMRRLQDTARGYTGMRKGAIESKARVSRLLIRQTYNRSTAHWEEFQTALHGWIDTWPIPFGIHATTDLLARYVVEACLHRGLRIPEDVAVIGADNENPICQQPEPTLTSIDCGFSQIGYRAAEMLDTMMDGEVVEAGEYLLGRERLVARHSTDVFAVEDELVAEALRYMSENCHQPIGVDDVVAQAATSRRSLERRFLAAMGRSVAAEINRMRVSRLQRLLVETDEPLERLSEQCGFTNTEHMRRNFFQRVGENPAHYRRERRA